jgi:hypothetical protein
MGRIVRDGTGVLLVGTSMAVLFWAIVQLRAHDYVAAILLTVAALSTMRAGADLLRPTLGE